jgi:hypothetical protein
VPKPTSLIVTFIICIAGYLLLDGLHTHKWKLKRSSGYHTFLMSSAWGLVLLCLSTFLYFIFSKLCDLTGFYFSLGDFVLNNIFKSDADPTSITLFDISIITIISSRILPVLIYRSRENQIYNNIVSFSEDSDSPEFTKLFFNSLKLGIPILFTMSDRKVYIGYIREVNTGHFKDIQVLPIFSGYRDKDTLNLVPITPYEDVIRDLRDESNDHEIDLNLFLITLPLREIVHAHLHDFKYYEHFKRQEANYGKEVVYYKGQPESTLQPKENIDK